MASLVERNRRYCVVYSYKDKTGKRRQKWETYKTMQEAKKRKKEIEYRADVGQMVVPHCKTVKELMEEYIILYGKEAWALSTYSSNVSMINNYIVPIIGGDKRVDKAAIQELHGKDVILVFPEESRKNKTVRVLKLPKTESSIRKVFLPKSVAEMLVKWKKGQDKIKETLGDEYMDYNLVMVTPFGLPIGTSSIRKALNDLIKEHNLPPVVFHSLRHTSVTYKLKLNGGDIKAVQGDSGHSQINMVTDVYSHIIDDDRRKNAELFEEAFYEKKDLDPSMHAHAAGKTVELPTDVDAELLAKVLSNPEMAALLSTLAKSLEKK